MVCNQFCEHQLAKHKTEFKNTNHFQQDLSVIVIFLILCEKRPLLLLTKLHIDKKYVLFLSFFVFILLLVKS